MATDVAFVTVGAMWLHGWPDFETYHVRLLNGRFKKATLTPLQIATRFLHPDIAVVHCNWRMAGDRNTDGTQRQPRYGMMTMVAEKKQNGAWLLVVAQNDNSMPAPAPEAQGITNPIPILGSGTTSRSK